MQNKKLQVWLPLLFSIVMILGMFIGFRIKSNMPGKSIFYTEKSSPVQEVLNLIQTKYVDEVNLDSMSNNALETILGKLDPHSVYMPPSQLQEAKEDIQGRFYGIGVEFNLFSDTINIVNVIKNGPSDKAGLEIGDKFIKVEDLAVAGVHITGDKIKKLLRGDGGTKVDITILRSGTQKHVIVVRGMIPLYSLDAAYMINDSTGFIRLNKFSETTYREFMKAAENLNKLGMKNMILDLRDNGGGILTEATEIADEFLDDDKLITYTEGKHTPRKEYTCKREGIFEKGRLVILANENTASASEVLIGALQDWDRATIVGRRSFGKGLVQEQYELSDGSGLRLTVARYYTPLGRSIQKSYEKGEEEYHNEVLKRFHQGELLHGDSIKHANARSFKTKSGKIVYSGGGITPDIFVGLDTAGLNKHLTAFYIKGTINDFVYRNYLDNKSKFASFKSPLEFENKYLIDPATWTNLLNYAKRDSIDLRTLTILEKEALGKQIKILTARQIWQNEGLYEVSNAEDETVKKAIEVITHPRN